MRIPEAGIITAADVSGCPREDRRVGAHALTAALTAAIPAAVSAFVLRKYVIDDAYITFTYAKNFARYGQLAIRPDNHVFADSSVSWSLLLGALTRLAGSPVAWAKILEAVFLVVAVVCMALALARGRTAAQVAALAAVGATSSEFILWANYGMENALYAVAVWLLAFGLVDFDRRWGRVLIASAAVLVYTTRPEGFMVVGGFLGVDALWRLRARRLSRDWVVCAGMTLALIGVIALIELGYYGSVLPNSATAKVVGALPVRLHAGARYFLTRSTYLGAWPIPLALLTAAAGGAWIRHWTSDAVPPTRTEQLVMFGLVFASLQCALVMVTGFDWMPDGRLVAASSPFCAMYLTERLLGPDPQVPAWRRTALAAFGVVWLSTQTISFRQTLRTVKQYDAADHRVLVQMVGDLNGISTSRDVLALSDIGRAAYFYVGDLFDWWGLASATVNRRGESLGRIEPQTVYEVNPAFLVLYSNGPTIDASRTAGAFDTTLRFLQDDRLNQRYCFAKAYEYLPYRYHILLIRRDLIGRVIGDAAFPEANGGRCVPAFTR